ncbi:hypothetical protein BH23ACT5_BH23ACT5_01250 [soil metagenome]
MRSSMIGLIAVVLVTTAPGGTFTDDNGSVHESAIEAVAAAGVARGCDPPDNTRFCP